jgi:hypothetical protein
VRGFGGIGGEPPVTGDGAGHRRRRRQTGWEEGERRHPYDLRWTLGRGRIEQSVPLRPIKP